MNHIILLCHETPRGYSKRNSRAIEEMLGLFPLPLNGTTTQTNSIKHEFKI